MSMTTTTVLLLLAAPPPPEVTAHNQAAMAHYERGDLEAAYAEFGAAYAALPDPIRDREAREDIMGSLRGVLRRLHAADPRTPEPLCRLSARLRGHIEALTAAHPGQLDLLEIRGNQELLAAVTHDLAPYGPTACDPPPPEGRSSPEKSSGPPGPPSAARPPEGRSPAHLDAPGSEPGFPGTREAIGPPPPATAPPPLHPPTDGAPQRRRLRIAGGALLGLGGLAFVGTAALSGLYSDRYRRLDALDRRLDTTEEIAERQRRFDAAMAARTAMIVTGSVAAALIAGGVAALVKARSQRRLSAAPSLAPGAWGIHLEGRF